MAKIDEIKEILIHYESQWVLLQVLLLFWLVKYLRNLKKMSLT